MALTPEEKQRIDEEEKYRAEAKNRHEKSKKGIGKGLGCVVIIVVIIVIGIIAAAIGGDDTSNTSSSTPSTTSKTEVWDTATRGDKSLPHFEDGIHMVGSDIDAGTYRTRVGSSLCYYARLSGLGGELEEIISNNSTSDPAVIIIKETDVAFESSGCPTWTKDLTQITNNATSFNDGVYIVGTDIEAGTYKNSGNNSCYYARLSGFTGELDVIISNDNADAIATVSIASTDAGFESSGCGTWSKID